MVEEGREKKSWWQKQVHDYKQQKSWVWRPVYTVHTMWFPFFCMGCFMLFWGIVLLAWQGDYNEVVWDYTDCCEERTKVGSCDSLVRNNRTQGNKYEGKLNIPFPSNQSSNKITFKTDIPLTSVEFRSGEVKLHVSPTSGNFFTVTKERYEKKAEEFRFSMTFTGDKDPIISGISINGKTICSTGKCTCWRELNITEENDMSKWDRDIMLYYGLDNFHQNHRQYADSRDDNQLDGKRLDNDGLSDLPSSDCEAPYHSDNSSAEKQLPIMPCGSIANSLFNDTVKLYFYNSEEYPADWHPPKQKHWQKVSLLKTGIAMPMDKKRFNNPANIDKVKDLEGEIARPIGWTKDLWELDPDNEENNGLENEDLIVWMRAAPTGSFRKLWRKVDHDNDSHIELKDGLLTSLQYRVEVDYNYDVSGFGGRKKVIITRANYLGSKNAMRGYVVIAAAIFYFFFSALFWVIARKENNLQRKGSKDN